MVDRTMQEKDALQFLKAIKYEGAASMPPAAVFFHGFRRPNTEVSMFNLIM